MSLAFHVILLVRGAVTIFASFVDGTGVLFFANQFVDVSQQCLDALPFRVNFTEPVFALQQIQQNMQILKQVFLARHGVSELSALEQLLNDPHLANDPVFLAATDRPEQEVRPLGIIAPHLLSHFPHRLLKSLKAIRQRLLIHVERNLASTGLSGGRRFGRISFNRSHFCRSRFGGGRFRWRFLSGVLPEGGHHRTQQERERQ